MSELKIINDKKVDHPRKKSKDLSDAVTGAVFGALSHTPKKTNLEIDIHTWSRSSQRLAEQEQRMVELDNREIPEEVRDYLVNFNLL
jgi:RNA:NAD 2'-phosphotransferase (TPT1/KptA family)